MFSSGKLFSINVHLVAQGRGENTLRLSFHSDDALVKRLHGAEQRRNLIELRMLGNEQLPSDRKDEIAMAAAHVSR